MMQVQEKTITQEEQGQISDESRRKKSMEGSESGGDVQTKKISPSEVRQFMSDSEIEEMRQAFDVYDKNGNGKISEEELKAVMTALNQHPDDECVKKYISEGDMDGDGEIDFEEFLCMMYEKQKTPRTDEDFKKAFKVFDVNDDGYISHDELKSVMECLGEKLSEEELNAMINEADTDGDGQVNFKEFKEMMKRNTKT